MSEWRKTVSAELVLVKLVFVVLGLNHFASRHLQLRQ